MNKRFLYLIFTMVFFLCCLSSKGAIEHISKSISNNQVSVGATLQVVDDKFNMTMWPNMVQSSVKNYITLKILDKSYIPQDFQIEMRVRVKHFSHPQQVVPTEIYPVLLKVNYKVGTGAIYELSNTYEFSGAHHIEVEVDDIESPQYASQLPVGLELLSGIIVDRTYSYHGTVAFSASYITPATNAGKQLLNVHLDHVIGAEEYDLEWTPVDDPSEYAEELKGTDVSVSLLREVFRNNATRVTLKGVQDYSISLIYNSRWIAIRARGVSYNSEGLRVEGLWSYHDIQKNDFAIYDEHQWHGSTLNWQYSASFAEEGKKKEVVSYFDGSLRNRQTVTLSNTNVDPLNNQAVSIVQENIYDEFGRVAANILPAPIKQGGNMAYLNLIKGVNQNNLVQRKNYTFRDLDLNNCEPAPAALSLNTGAAGYYGANNDFANSIGNKFLPKAEGFPLSVNLYTPDNTGRLAKQGNVGATFQPGPSSSDRTTKYYYGKPEQWELDAVFGNDAGFAGRYQKNMVIDPNDQASITYINAAGKTVATALTGKVPDNLSALNTASNIKTINSNLLSADQFKFEASALKITATTSYISSVITSEPTTFTYNLNQLISRYPNVFDPCSNCYYKLSVSVKDDCGIEQNSTISTPIFLGSALSNPQVSGQVTGTVDVALNKIGTFFITMELALDSAVIKDYTQKYIKDFTDNGYLTKRQVYIDQELRNLENYFLGCFTGCDATKKLGLKEDFRAMFKQYLRDLGEPAAILANNTTIYDLFIDGNPANIDDIGLYQRLYNAAVQQEATCNTPSLSECDEKRKLLLGDVSPNGQFALFDVDGNPLESEINILYLHFRNVFSGTPNPEDEITLENGNKLSPYDQNFQLQDLVKYWKPQWAERFIGFHPEFCKLEFCGENFLSENWDSKLKKMNQAPSSDVNEPNNQLTGHVVFNEDLTASDWLVQHDPFFKVGGLGHDYASLMSLDLINYSKNVLKRDVEIDKPLKNLLQVNLVQLYCAVEDNSTNDLTNVSNPDNIWVNCNPIPSCRVFAREWQLYRDGYLQLKQIYIDKLRKSTTCSESCEVGRLEGAPCTEVVTLNNTAHKVMYSSFTQFTEIDPATGYRFYYNLVPGNQGQLPTTGLCEFSAIDSEFYPCITVKYPGNAVGEQFNNVWKINCVKEEVECSSSSAEIIATVRHPDDPNVFYHNVGSTQQPIWDRYTIYQGYSTPPATFCSPQIPAEFFRCVNVYYNNQVIEYNNVYVGYCPLQGGAGPIGAGRMAQTNTIHNQRKGVLDDNLNNYISSKSQLEISSKKQFLEVDTIYPLLRSDLLNGSIYAVISADSIIAAPNRISSFTAFELRESLLLVPARNYLVKLKNVWVAELIADSGSRKYNERRIADKIKQMTISKTASAKVIAHDQKSGTGMMSMPTSTSSPCIMVSDDALDYYNKLCNGNTYWTSWRRTTVWLSSGVAPATLPHDVTVTIAYTYSPSGLEQLVDVVIPAGQTTVFYEYDGENWSDNGSGCEKTEITFKCVKRGVGADICWNELSCGSMISCSPLLANKVSRFPVVALANVAEFDAAEYELKNAQEIKRLVDDASIGHADNWMTALSPALNGSINQTNLHEALRGVSAQALHITDNLSFVNGLSSLPPNLSFTLDNIAFANYGQVLKHYFGINKFTNSINPWLLEGPVPYPMTDGNGDFINKMQTVPVTISNTNEKICDKLNSLKPSTPNPITDEQFYTYLQGQFGNLMSLSLDEFKVLVKGCECRYILAKDIKLPVFLEPGAKGVITMAEYQAAISEMNLAFDTPPATTWSNYETIVSNFLNHKFGFALSYNQYKTFADQNVGNPSAVLSNVPPYVEPDIDPYDCVRGIIATAFYTADPLYQAYIDQEKQLFRQAYISTCGATNAKLDISARQNIYHYTLYYYDQAGNLTRTVPPAGVTLLTDVQQAEARKFRDFDGYDCIYTGPSQESATSTALSQLSSTISASGNHALEFWLHQSGAGDRQLSALTPDNKYLMQFCLSGQQLFVDIYTLDPLNPYAAPFIQSKRMRVSVGSAAPTLPWMHVVLQGNGLSSGAIQIWVNGQQRTVTNNTNTSICFGSTPLQASQNLAILKHLRHYNRLMTSTEISANAQNACLNATGAYDIWQRLNVPIMGGPTTIAANSTNENQFRNGIYPNHALITSYAYNSSGQVVSQQTPDAGSSNFWYDYLNRLVFSQNAQQLLDNQYSYTEYDDLGRVKEVGRLDNPTQLGEQQYLAQGSISNYIANGTKAEITQTYYDLIPDNTQNQYPGLQTGLVQQNLRKRVVASVYRDNLTSTDINASYYSYDMAGNVKTLYQQIADLGTKKIDYEYDLVSGKINFLAYQHGQNDAFYYRYDYDAENRLINAWSSIVAHIDNKGFGSSINGPYKRLDASYQYYLHGPLARIELGDQGRKVQGIDYAYTLQGWLKGVNGTSGQTAKDMGMDAHPGSLNSTIPKDVFGFALSYYGFEDYKPRDGSLKPFSDAQSASAGFAKLYNGNIGGISLDNPTLGVPQLYTYKYDQLNRLVKTFTYNGLNTNNNTWNVTADNSYREDFTYDANGNIEKLSRYGNVSTSTVLMDKLTYGYNKIEVRLVNNRLRHVKDDAPSAAFTTDIDDQLDDNYNYDANGNLTRDSSEGISRINWSIYGKPISFRINNGNIGYHYNGLVQRVAKTFEEYSIFYVRDAQGNVLAEYFKERGTNKTTWREQHLYGSSRLGMWKPNLVLGNTILNSNWETIGNKSYEMSNHLGNVLTVINENPTTNSNGALVANVLNAKDYYPFGSQMPGRSFNLDGSYRYGFNGKENDNEVKGEGNQQDYGMRIYDPRLSRFLSVDPITRQYPELTPYQFASNTPIQAIDLDGLEEYHYTLTLVKEKPVLKLATVVNEKKFLDLIPYKPSLSHVIEYNGETYSFGTHNGLNTIGRTATEAAREFVKNPDAGNFVPNSAVEGMRDETEALMGGVLSLSKMIVDKSLNQPEGIIYKRRDKTGNEKDYVGQAKNPKRYKERQKEHQRGNKDADYEFEKIDRGKHGKNLDAKEQKHIDAGGGPTNKSNPNGGLSNKKNVIKKDK